MADENLTEEDVFANDKDPLDAIREIRKEEGVPEEELPVSDAPTASQDDSPAVDGDDELDNLQENEENNTADKEEDQGDSDKNELDSDSEQNLGDDDGEEDPSEDPDEDSDNDADKDLQAESEAAIRKFTANGKDFEFTEKEILEQFEVIFGQAMDYTQKTQKMAPFRKMISALEEENISADQLNVAIDALKGNKQALQILMKNNDIDPLDIDDNADESNPYQATDYGKDDTQLGIDDITTRISSDKEYQITVDVVDNQWDDNSRNVLSSNPSMIEGLHNDIKSGVYDKVAPVAMKMKVLDGNTKSDIEYYMLAGEKVLSEEQNSDNTEQSVDDMNKKAQDAEENFDQASSEAQQKRSASSTRKRSDRNKVTDYLDDDDEKFDAWYKKLQASH